MLDYYARLEDLRGRLLAAGQDNWAMELLSAERSAGTSGEALSETRMVLKRLIDSTEPDVADFRDEAQAIYHEAHRLWYGK